MKELKAGLTIFHTSQTRCILFLLCLDKYLPTRTAVCNVEINQMFKIIKNTFLSAVGKERCGMKGQVLKWTYRQWFYSSVPLSIPVKMNLKVTFNLFANLQYQQNNYGHYSQMECTLKDWAHLKIGDLGFFSFFSFFLPSVAAFKWVSGKKYSQGKEKHRWKKKSFMRMYWTSRGKYAQWKVIFKRDIGTTNLTASLSKGPRKYICDLKPVSLGRVQDTFDEIEIEIATPLRLHRLLKWWMVKWWMYYGRTSPHPLKR